MNRYEWSHEDRGIFAEEHHAFRETVRRFYEREVEPNIEAWETRGIFDRELFRKAGAAGLLCAGIPTEYGGGGGDVQHHVICYEEHGYTPAGASLGEGIDTDTSAYMILAAGTEEQKRFWLPRYASGEVVAEGAFTEPQSGSDLGSVRTTAVRDGSDYVINGSKIWITNANHLDMCLLVARTSAPDAPIELSLFLVDMNLPGVARGHPLETLHRGCGNLGEIFFTDVRVPADQLLGGKPGAGPKHAGGALNIGRLAMSARIIATCELALRMTVDFVKERQAFGKPLYTFQHTQFQLTDIKAQVEVGRAFVDKCLVKALHGRLAPADASIAKLWTSEAEARVMDVCVQMHGAIGLSHEHAISKMYTAARSHRMLMGTSEMQRMTILRAL
jgi:alkylation response protein AidB-like acyl-CoA dehydrogenase